MSDPNIAGPGPRGQGSLHQRIVGYWSTFLVYAAARLELADLLADGPRTSAALAVRTGTDHARLHRLLRGLVAIEILVEEADGSFALTAMGAELRRDVRGSLRAWALFNGENALRAWSQITDVMRSDRSGFELAAGTSLYTHLSQHPEEDAIWNDCMANSARAWLEDGGLLDKFAWRDGQVVVDVGGGHGSLLAGLLARHPGLRGVLFDLPHVVAGAGPLLQTAGVAERCQIVGGDATQAIPSGGDVYLFARVLFNWDDANVGKLLESCAQVLQPHAKIIAIETVLADGREPDPASIIDLNNLMLFGGRARLVAEWTRLFAAAGLILDRAIRVGPLWTLLEGYRPAP